MNKYFSAKLILIFILAIATFLRFWNLGNVPPSASLDEASIGYNAYSVLKTGKDEYKEFPLISQRGYDDWRRSTYLFLVVPFVDLFDLNVIAVRLPAVILSVLTVWASYYIVLLLFSKRSEFSTIFALFTSFLLAISPWHIYISRLGHESNACLSFLVFGVLFFLIGQRNKKGIFLSMIFFTLSMISYYSGQVFIPLFVLGLFVIFRKTVITIFSSSKKAQMGMVAFLVFLVPLLFALFSPAAITRFSGTSVFNVSSFWQENQARLNKLKEAKAKDDSIGQVVNSQKFFIAGNFVKGYFSHFDIKWLTSNSSNEPFKAPNVGLLYIWMIPFIVIGIINLIFTPLLDGKAKKLIFLWFFLGPLPGAIATQAPHAMRSYNVLPVWQIFAAFGLTYVFFKLKKFNKFILLIFSLCVLISLVTFYKNYFIVFPKEQSSSFQYALAKTIPYVLSQKNNYQRIILSNSDNLYQSYMLFLYYSKYDPLLYQKLGGTMSGGFAKTHVFDKYEFRPIDWNKDRLMLSTLFIGNITEFPQSINAKSFDNLDGKSVIQVVGLK